MQIWVVIGCRECNHDWYVIGGFPSAYSADAAWEFFLAGHPERKATITPIWV